ncbi:MAG: methylmalonyl-CoA mutase family protein [Candidatus Delongbacteria bacterium]|nr:methylmalonyl-CoA mutase family protein [Candidatus Delongbacteria bacterium]
MSKPTATRNQLRFVTAASLFDGHDASINIIRRVLQASGTEVIHLGHNRSVGEIVDAAIQEDAHAIAVSSYQGGHVQFFKYMIDLLAERNASHIRVFGGGGGVIIPEEIKELQDYGVVRIYSPEDGTRIGMQGIIDDMRIHSDYALTGLPLPDLAGKTLGGDFQAIARCITILENGVESAEVKQLLVAGKQVKQPVVGITGTGGAGKSSLVDELVRRFTNAYPDKRVGIISIDPSKHKTGGALLGDRIRLNSLSCPRIFMHSLATRGSGSEVSAITREALQILRAAQFDLILLETSGIGQGDMGIVELVDFSLYVMTHEYGASSQLEKIDMIDYADMVVLNKFEKLGSDDALRDVRRQYRRSHNTDWEITDQQLPVYGTVASRFNSQATAYFYQEFIRTLAVKFKLDLPLTEMEIAPVEESYQKEIIPGNRIHYLREIAENVRNYKQTARQQAEVARNLWHLRETLQLLPAEDTGHNHLEQAIQDWDRKLDTANRDLLAEWPELQERYRRDNFDFQVRDKALSEPLYRTSLSGTRIPRVALPDWEDEGETLKFLLLENLPGRFPFTAGAFPFKRREEEPKRQFAGEGPPIRTNKRFHYLSRDDSAKRLSTAFDSVTLYGDDPHPRPDIYGKVGESGVSICTLDNVKTLYEGFDLTAPNTSVSMTINGPAPIMLAMFLNTAIDQEADKFRAREGRAPDAAELNELRNSTLQTVRGTVQADILKEDQAQNTCIFSIDFSLKMMGDIQEYFVHNSVRNYYSVSISGYHIAEAGANPITQLAFTLANGFTYLEYYRSRGMDVDRFAPNLSFFFSNGLDPEYSVIGRVARRIWAVALRDLYDGNERSQKLKYHIQTSGRSLHSQEMQFNDIRTTLQALQAIYDNCNSLHTNSYDEAITTPSEEAVRRAMAIQMIINREFGNTLNENTLQGSFIMEELTELVEEAVLDEFLRLNSRGGVLGAMELQYQRSRIQEESMYYELRKESGELPIIGVNTYLNPRGVSEEQPEMQLARATPEEKQSQLEHVLEFQQRDPEQTAASLQRLREVAMAGENIFAELMETVRHASLGQITHTLYEVGGQYRRNM